MNEAEFKERTKRFGLRVMTLVDALPKQSAISNRKSPIRWSRWPLSGFTLIEVLATLMLVAIVLPVVMNGLSLCLATAGHARSQTEASSLAQTKLTELLMSTDLPHAALSGDFGSDWPGYRWTAQVAGWEGTTLRQVDVTVTWKQRGKERAVTLTTLMYPLGVTGG